MMASKTAAGRAKIRVPPKNARPILTLPRDDSEYKLFIEPDEWTPDVAKMDKANRDNFAEHCNYADRLGAGNPHTFDEQGDYNCGRCNKADGDRCLLIDIKRIDRKAGSCEDWEAIALWDPEMRLFRKSDEVANYGVAENGEGFGCHRCPFSKKAKNTDSEGRDYWCGYGGFHIVPFACCTLNGAETVDDGDNDADDS